MKFKKDIKTVKKKLSEGGEFIGPRHAQGGIKFQVESTGETVEVEGAGVGPGKEYKHGEFLLCNNAMDNEKEGTWEGKPREILSEINTEHGCKGLNEKATDIKGGESVINLRSMNTDDELVCEGTPEGVASAINEYGKGVKFSDKGKCRVIKRDIKNGIEKQLVKSRLEDSAGMNQEGGRTYESIIKTNAFKKWFGDWEKDPENSSKVVDENGKPLIVYHGTTHKFTVFSTEKSNIESDFGSAYYFSSNKTDASVNYNEQGQDITNRIERLSERIQNEEGISESQAKYKAKKKLIGGKSMVLSVFLNFRNPFIVGGKNETYLDYNYDPDTGEESGNLIDFINGLRNAAYKYNDIKIDEAISELIENHMDGARASEIIDTLKKSEKFVYATDDEGDLASNEVLRAAIENAGYDGVIDNTVSKKWGYQSGRRNYMEGVDENTKHFVAFHPNQIKLADGKNKKFDPNNPDIRKNQGGIIDWDNLPDIYLGEEEDLLKKYNKFLDKIITKEINQDSDTSQRALKEKIEATNELLSDDPTVEQMRNSINHFKIIFSNLSYRKELSAKTKKQLKEYIEEITSKNYPQYRYVISEFNRYFAASKKTETAFNIWDNINHNWVKWYSSPSKKEAQQKANQLNREEGIYKQGGEVGWDNLPKIEIEPLKDQVIDWLKDNGVDVNKLKFVYKKESPYQKNRIKPEFVEAEVWVYGPESAITKSRASLGVITETDLLEYKNMGQRGVENFSMSLPMITKTTRKKSQGGILEKFRLGDSISVKDIAKKEKINYEDDSHKDDDGKSLYTIWNKAKRLKKIKLKDIKIKDLTLRQEFVYLPIPEKSKNKERRIEVVYKDKKYYLMDGYHRTMFFLDKEGKDSTMKAIIYYDSDK